MALFLSLLSFTVCLGSLTLCLLVFMQERSHSMLHISYFVSAIAGSVWALAYTGMYQSQDANAVIFLYRLGSVGWTVGIAYGFLFTYYLFCGVVGKKASPLVLLLTTLSAAAFWLAAWSGRIFSTHFQIGAIGWQERADPASPWVFVYLVWVTLINALMILFSVLAARKTTLNRSRRMVRMIIIPSALFGPVAIFTNLALPLLGSRGMLLLGSPWLPPLSHVIFGVVTIVIGLAVLRYRILSIEPGFVIERLFLDITDMVVLTDMDGVIRKSNHSLSNQPGLFPEPLVGKPVRLILPEVELRGQAIYRAPHKNILESNLRLPSGDLIPVRVSLSVVCDLHDDPVGYYFLLRDLRDLRQIADFATRLQETNQKLEQLSSTDALTGIWNRAKFNELLCAEFERYKRYCEPFSLLLVDVDKFKLINDTYGHLAGDQVLKDIVANLRQGIRSTDVFARWGGDEFAILLPYLDTPGAVQVIQRLRKAIACLEGGPCVTLSIGLSTVRASDSLTTLFERADAAVYKAKEQGGDCFVLG